MNSFIGLFKDTTLVSIVGIFDFLRTIELARIDPIWAAPSTSATGYVFAAMFYFICCYGMSLYAKSAKRGLPGPQALINGKIGTAFRNDPAKEESGIMKSSRRHRDQS